VRQVEDGGRFEVTLLLLVILERPRDLLTARRPATKLAQTAPGQTKVFMMTTLRDALANLDNREVLASEWFRYNSFSLHGLCIRLWHRGFGR
jgi:hypothetical protein